MNIKILGSMVALSLLANASLANDSSFFIGADVSYVNTNVNGDLRHNKTGLVVNGDLSSNIPILGLRAGYSLNDLNRFYVAYNYSDEFSEVLRTPKIQINEDFTTHKFLLGYDFTPEIFDKTRAVLGVFGGYAKSDVTLKTKFLSLSQNFDGFVYGAKIGALYEINDSNDVEIGFKVEHINYNTKDFYQEAIGSNLYDPKQKSYGAYIAYTYKF